MRNVYKTTREITGVGGLQSGVGKTFTSTVRRNEIFENGQAVSETRFNGNFDLFTLRVHHQSAHTGKLLDLVDGTARARVSHHPDGVELIRFALLFKQFRHFRGSVVPLIDHGVVALFFGKQTSRIFLRDFAHRFFGFFYDFRLFFGNLHIEYRSGESGKRRILVTSFLDRIKNVRGLGRRARSEARFHDSGKMLLADRAFVADKFGVEFETKIRLRRIAMHEIEILRQTVVVDKSADRGADDTHHFSSARLFVQTNGSALDRRFAFRHVFIEIAFAGVRQRQIVEFPFGKFHNALQIHFVLFVRHFRLISDDRFVFRRIYGRNIHFAVFVRATLRIVFFTFFAAFDRKAICADNHILRRRHNRFTVGKFQNVIRRKHQKSRFRLSLDAEGKVHGHLVAVEVGVERSADKGRNLDRSALDQNGLERLNGKTVQRRRTV